MQHVLAGFGLDPQQFDVQPFGSGHINKTFLAADRNGGAGYVLQQINTQIFKQPAIIARNHKLTADFLAERHPSYFFVRAIPAKDGGEMFIDNDTKHWRLLPHIANTYTVDQADTPKQAYEAAKQFGRFAKLTTGIELSTFAPSIPNFHDLSLRYEAFASAIQTGSAERRQAAANAVAAYLALKHIAKTYAGLIKNNTLPTRLMHHDTKINNVLLRQGTHAGVCVVDLDTLMPGKVISDLGDMVRTYVSPVSEEERDLGRVVVREDFFLALIDGYLSEVRDALTPAEKAHVFYAGQFMVYMQGIRFLTDFLNGDVYYPIKYPHHNLDRACNQLTLLQRLNEKQDVLQHAIDKCL